MRTPSVARRILLGVVGAGAVVGLVLAVVSERQDERPFVHVENADPEGAADYWTEERLRDAEPAPMPSVRD